MTPQIKQRIDQIQRGEVPEGYKRTKVGIIPSTWHTFSLGDLYTERKESGIPSLPILTVSIHSGVSDGALDDDEIGKKVKRIEDKTQYRTARSGDVVFNMMRAWQGAIGVVRQDGLVSPAYIVATPNEAVYPPFMDYCLKTPQMINRLHRKSYGVTDFRLRLYWDSFAKVDCVLPPFSEQKKIAEILSAQDKLIASKEKLIEEKKRQKKALMQQLLTGKQRFHGFFDEWCHKRISDICDVLDTLRKPLNASERAGRKKEYPYYGANGIVDYIDEYLLDDSVILLAEDGGNFENFNNKPIAYWVEGKCWVNNHAHILKPQKKYCEKFVFYALEHKDIRVYINGTTRSKLTQEDLLTIDIFLPTQIEEQQMIAMILGALDREVSLLQKDLDQEKQKKKALMQLLLTGIVRVNENE